MALSELLETLINMCGTLKEKVENSDYLTNYEHLTILLGDFGWLIWCFFFVFGDFCGFIVL